ncbi:kelch repeat-containing protein [Paraburkholderia bonniea]|uniref:kelch repeat-containing protein n=1 Tax=Paraburkholderia bonniea TaxID=2152891 RepID=UPI001580ECC4|nr:kelch repeat-containing protein [Paraburkholderia bonniea]WJF89082.1 kelch repeat-containing protein [Paraburkholderia bonniea]WJF92398.1 kelch repeat-containing protein [Paraburkholderia bonniea]
MIRLILLVLSSAILLAACGSGTRTVAAPAGLHYTTLNPSYAANQPIVPNTPASSGGPISRYAVNPALPAGLTLDAITGVISGTPAQPSATAIYTVSGSNLAGTATTAVSITVTSDETAPVNLAYSAGPVSYEVGVAITPNLPHSEGGAITAWRVTPDLPPGLTLDAASGVISGTPSVATAAATYTVSGSNGAGTASAALAITAALPAPPQSLAYAQSWMLGGEGRVQLTNSAQQSGGAIRWFTVTPALPAGLSLNTQSGEISGTPAETVSRTDYLVTGSNAAGRVNTTVSLEVVKPGTWAKTNPMGQPRNLHSATLMADGKVLVVAGTNESGGIYKTAEIYDPAHGTWNATLNPPSTPRYLHQAVLLTTGPHVGSVLVVGGAPLNVISRQADRYDPASGIWTRSSGLMSVSHMLAQSTTALADGNILVVGGSILPYPTPATPVAERYDSALDSWTLAGTMKSAHLGHTATLLPNQTVLVTGGMEGASVGSFTELYLPGTNSWELTGQPASTRLMHSATLLANGQVLVAGGKEVGGVSSLTSAELYDPETGKWSSTGAMSTGHQTHCALRLADGRVLVAGGLEEGDVSIAATELYDPETGKWTSAGPMSIGRSNFTMTLLANGQVLAAGRRMVSGETNGDLAEIFVP